MGRHPIGYEVQKVLAAVDWLVKQPRGGRQIGVLGYGEGGLLALYSAALDTRIDVCGVSGYFDSRQEVWQEPIYRNIWRLLDEFGDAELASLVAPRALVVEACAFPKINNVGPVREGRPNNTAAPGVLRTPDLPRVRDEYARAQGLVKGLKTAPWGFYPSSDDGQGEPMSGPALSAFVAALIPGADELRPPQATPVVASKELDIEARQKRQLDQLLEHTQALLRESEYVRAARFKVNTSSIDAYKQSTKPLREEFYNDVIGRFDIPLAEPNVRTRQVYDEPKFTGYEVVMDVFADAGEAGAERPPSPGKGGVAPAAPPQAPTVIAYGILLLPKDLKPGERRPVVVCQHGLEGRPQDVAHGASKKENPAYNNYAAKLAERGFITYAPQNPYIFWDRFRTLQRKANPLGKSLFSIIIPQHEQTVRWLASLPNVDPQRIAFYGLSYGGKTAMRVPAVVEEYCLSICSADFNEWVWKNASTRSPYSYVWTGEYEIFEFDLGSTFNYAEMAALIAPRPFMVERGHFDGVASDETVAHEFAKVRHHYAARLGLGDRCEIEWFVGPHTINGQGTFRFLHKHLSWP
jgi:dienelactone hydrolase